MTVVYMHEVATAKVLFGNFRRLLFRWTGSIYKIVGPNLAVYMLLYYIINISYRCFLATRSPTDKHRVHFELLVVCSAEVTHVLPLQFVLGFYISQIVSRWWNQFMSIPWPDTLSVSIATHLKGHDDRGRLMRRTILRYVNVALVMVLTMISPQVRSRFPTLDNLVEAGFLVPHEKLIIENLNEKSEGPKYYVPIVWASSLVIKARKEGRIGDDIACYQIIKELCRFRSMAGDLLSYDWICIPMVYTQVATLCTYVYFMACLFGKQLISSPGRLDIYFPVFHFLEFFFLMGWLKVGETMINPFGEDDDDFEVNWLIDRNLKVSYMIVDEMHMDGVPEMLRDIYWDGVIPDQLYYTQESLKYKTGGMGYGSASHDVPPEDESRNKDEISDYMEGTNSLRKRMSLAFSHSIKTISYHSSLRPHALLRARGSASRSRSRSRSLPDITGLLDRSSAPSYKESSQDVTRQEDKDKPKDENDKQIERRGSK